jgi:trigger factor
MKKTLVVLLAASFMSIGAAQAATSSTPITDWLNKTTASITKAETDTANAITAQKKAIKKQKAAQKKAEAERKFDEDVFEAVVEANPVEVPQAMVDTEVQTMVSEMTENLSRQGLNMDLYTQLTGQSLDDMKAQMADQAEKRVKFQLIIDAVVKAENIEVTDEELDEQYKEIAAYYSRDVEEIKKIFAGQEYRVKADVANKKAVDFIKENVSK